MLHLRAAMNVRTTAACRQREVNSLMHPDGRTLTKRQQLTVYLADFIAFKAVFFVPGASQTVLGLDALSVRAGVLIMVDLTVRRRVFRRVRMVRRSCSHYGG